MTSNSLVISNFHQSTAVLLAEVETHGEAEKASPCDLIGAAAVAALHYALVATYKMWESCWLSRCPS